MKTHIALAFLISALLVSTPFIASAQEMTKQDYLEKSRKKTKAGAILLGGGIVLFSIGGTLMAVSGLDQLTSCIGGNCSSGAEDGFAAGTVMMWVGGLSVVGSIPLLISAGNNRKKAAALSFSNEPIYVPKYAGNLPRAVPSITLKIRI
jgi:hypothetical protein